MWLVPEYTINPDQALTKIVFFTKTAEDPKYDDLGKGTGGDYRYLEQIRDPDENQKIVSLKLWRTDRTDWTKSELARYSGYTSDINVSRGKSTLLLCWNSEPVKRG